MKGKDFAFGKNWQSFVKNYVNPERVDEAKKSLANFLCCDNLEGKSFLDIGCGSGLFSLAAYKLGASKILSFDVDLDSVKCCNYLRESAREPSHWKVLKGSSLDENFVFQLERHDIVYSWGVLHHTGNMWKAIENTVKLVANHGLLYIAIYNKSECLGIYPDGRFGTSSFWQKEKRFYAKSPWFVQSILDHIIMGGLIFLYLATLHNPVKKIRSHKELRGMSWRIDIKDWLGGYPYEYASADEVFNFIKGFGFSLENLKCYNGLGNNEYLFKKNYGCDHEI
jgi:2-polyprenyl-3-methyl-5-hydroxy-6-metoxy-1,4-benzoquinol methylase